MVEASVTNWFTVYTAGSRTAKATQKNPVLKRTKKKNLKEECLLLLMMIMMMMLQVHFGP